METQFVESDEVPLQMEITLFAAADEGKVLPREAVACGGLTIKASEFHYLDGDITVGVEEIENGEQMVSDLVQAVLQEAGIKFTIHPA